MPSASEEESTPFSVDIPTVPPDPDVTPEEFQRRRSLWIQRLKFGGDAQCRGVLCKQDATSSQRSYCCLGLACDLYIQENPGSELAWDLKIDNGAFKDDSSGDEYFQVCAGYEYTVLPDEVAEWLGIQYRNGMYQHQHQISSEHKVDLPTLAALNDSGKTFAEIAHVIECNPPGLWAEGT